jgi:squalene synthase HpnC
LTSKEEIEAADNYCRYLANRHYENFSVASRILSSESRKHLARIYAFCRATDDLGDESQSAAVRRLELWQDELARWFDQGVEPIHPVLIALTRTIAECDLSRRPFFDLIRANLQDQRVASYETWDQLMAYCSCSAAPVGRMVLGVFGVRDPRAESLSDDVCNGLQLANFAQDVAVDHVKGRTYLVQSDIRDGGTRAAIRKMCDHAEVLLRSGLELERMAPLRLRIQLSLYRLGGCAIIAAVRQSAYATDSQRPRLSRVTKARLIPLALQQSARRDQSAQAHHMA